MRIGRTGIHAVPDVQYSVKSTDSHADIQMNGEDTCPTQIRQIIVLKLMYLDWDLPEAYDRRLDIRYAIVQKHHEKLSDHE